MPFLPEDFEVPDELRNPRFYLRHITVHDLVKDYDAVMSSRQSLWEMFGEAWGWPPEDLTLEEDLVDLAWHQKEAELRRAFNYAVVSLDGERLLGCVYIDPPEKRGYDAEVCFWVRKDELDTGLKEELEDAVRGWLTDDWPFGKIAYPGRDISWAEYDALPDATGTEADEQRNVALVHRYIEEVWHSGEVALLDEMFADGYRRHLSPADEPLDKEGQRERIVGFRAAFPDLHFAVEDVVSEGNRVVFRAVLSGTHEGDFMGIPATGRCISAALMDTVAFDGSGRFAEQWGGPDLWDIRRQLEA